MRFVREWLGKFAGEIVLRSRYATRRLSRMVGSLWRLPVGASPFLG